MAKDEDKRWQCSECRHISLESALLTEPSPFDPQDTLMACPVCLSVAGIEFKELCDEPGCDKRATCGFPAGDEFGGYRRTCIGHANFDDEVSL